MICTERRPPERGDKTWPGVASLGEPRKELSGQSNHGSGKRPGEWLLLGLELDAFAEATASGSALMQTKQRPCARQTSPRLSHVSHSSVTRDSNVVARGFHPAV